jgi:thymidylate synthase
MKTIFIEKNTLPEAWEEGVKRCWAEGTEFKTQYDRPGDPPSKDSTMLLHILNPFAEPRYHLGLPGGLEDVEKYVQEVVYGIHDHWMNDESNPNRWSYTYHQRLFKYGPIVEPIDVFTYNKYFNQIENIIQQLKDCSYTRRANVVTWQPWNDPNHHDSPCLQSLWFRIENNKLNMNVTFRSNDLLKAAFMNMVALTELQKNIAEKLGVEVGEYVHLSHSMHVYGKDTADIERFLSLCDKRTYENRTISSKDCAFSFIEGCNQLLAEENMPAANIPIIKERLEYWSRYV